MKNYWLIQFFLIVLMFLLMAKISLGFSYLSMGLSYDFLSYLMVMLSIWITFLMLMSSEKIFKMNDYSNLFTFFLLFLLVSLIMFFSVLNMFLFYFFFEVSLIPIIFIILGWGYQPERLQAGMYLFFYTMMASLPMLLLLIYLYNIFYSLNYMYLGDMDSLIFYLMMNMVFFVKIPMFLVHLWLPKAHVEAPVSGSMILAGVMLKMGGFGLIRFLKLFLGLSMKINFIFMNLSLLGGVLIGLVCVRQSDMKSLIAYSSVIHMGLMLSGLLTLSIWGLSGAIWMMVAHGLCSSGLFFLVNINYERFYSRSLYLNKGILNLAPSLSMFWFLLISSNMAAPPSLNLLSEIMLINSLLSYSMFFIFFIIIISFFSAVYSLYLFSFSQHGKLSVLFSFLNINIREYLVLFLHWIPLNILLLKSDLV
uniref:NADH-ubiquinone oxidoreductase chain 4 n=1 Tax=Nephaspis sp. DPP-2018 TaxID=2136114 RepID=A0A343YVM5_9CUCU|nr:NADH dehydrogenase subunit 4 [Nephaspis sp. DPP-2018]